MAISKTKWIKCIKYSMLSEEDETRPQATCRRLKISWNSTQVFEIYASEETDKHSDRHTHRYADHNTSHSYRRQSRLIFTYSDDSRNDRVFTCVYLFVCLFIRSICSQDHRTWHWNVPPWFPKTHFWSQKVKGQGRLFVRSFFAGRSPAYSGLQRWDLLNRSNAPAQD